MVINSMYHIVVQLSVRLINLICLMTETFLHFFKLKQTSVTSLLNVHIPKSPHKKKNSLQWFSQNTQYHMSKHWIRITFRFLMLNNMNKQEMLLCATVFFIAFSHYSHQREAGVYWSSCSFQREIVDLAQMTTAPDYSLQNNPKMKRAQRAETWGSQTAKL